MDDDPDIVELLRETLEEAGFHVSTAASGEAAIQQVSGEPQDVVLMDVVMPGISGVEAMEAIHRIRPGLPVALMSGAAPAGPWPPPGAKAFFPKPLDVGSLASRLRGLL
ncbi:MAG: response regulator [Euryarchaeota archaeon]|nr:response regulator [Euryarchaeota archaeon]